MERCAKTRIIITVYIEIEKSTEQNLYIFGLVIIWNWCTDNFHEFFIIDHSTTCDIGFTKNLVDCNRKKIGFNILAWICFCALGYVTFREKSEKSAIYGSCNIVFQKLKEIETIQK